MKITLNKDIVTIYLRSIGFLEPYSNIHMPISSSNPEESMNMILRAYARNKGEISIVRKIVYFKKITNSGYYENELIQDLIRFSKSEIIVELIYDKKSDSIEVIIDCKEKGLRYLIERDLGIKYERPIKPLNTVQVQPGELISTTKPTEQGLESKIQISVPINGNGKIQNNYEPFAVILKPLELVYKNLSSYCSGD